MTVLKGTTVRLHVREKTGEDDFGVPVYEETVQEVDNILIAPASTDDITSSVDLYGKKAVYVLAIPKGDQHVWTDAVVEFFGQKFRTFGFPLMGDESLTPLDWNAKVRVEAYEYETGEV